MSPNGHAQREDAVAFVRACVAEPVAGAEHVLTRFALATDQILNARDRKSRAMAYASLAAARAAYHTYTSLTDGSSGGAS